MERGIWEKGNKDKRRSSTKKKVSETKESKFIREKHVNGGI